MIVTGSLHEGVAVRSASDTNTANVQTEERQITEDRRQRRSRSTSRSTNEHYGNGEFRSEVANLSRNVIVESADPAGVRGHTMYHGFSSGGISYARFAHLGKEGVLGRYAIHFHLVGDTMRGSQVLGAAIVDSHNRWVTIHGTEYLVVRDCVGYRSVGHGYFMEDGTEVLQPARPQSRRAGLSRASSCRSRCCRSTRTTAPPSGGPTAATRLTRNVACENDEYGFRYDMQASKYFNSTCRRLMPDGKKRTVDVRTIPIWRFEDNESHTEGLYGMVVAGNNRDRERSASAPIASIRTYLREHARFGRCTTPCARRFRSMLIENVQIDHVAYGIYRPTFENHVYRNLTSPARRSEPFNRGMDDASTQYGTDHRRRPDVRELLRRRRHAARSR